MTSRAQIKENLVLSNLFLLAAESLGAALDEVCGLNAFKFFMHQSSLYRVAIG